MFPFPPGITIYDHAHYRVPRPFFPPFLSLLRSQPHPSFLPELFLPMSVRTWAFCMYRKIKEARCKHGIASILRLVYSVMSDLLRLHISFF